MRDRIKAFHDMVGSIYQGLSNVASEVSNTTMYTGPVKIYSQEEINNYLKENGHG